MTFYDSGEKTAEKKSPVMEPAPAPAPPKPAPEPAPAPKADTPPQQPPLASVVNFQIGAYATSGAAEKVMAEAKTKGFHAFMLTPVLGDTKPLYRVQIGPIRDAIEQESLRQQLTAAGYIPTLKP